MKDDDKTALVLNGATDCAASAGTVCKGAKGTSNGAHCEDTRKRITQTTNHGSQSPQVTAQVAYEEAPEETMLPTRTQVLTDWANLCTFLGAVLATLAMACMWKKRYYLGMFLNMFANIADILDGPIARSLPNRHPVFSVIGCKLDCYSDLVSHFVVPASLLMSISDLNPCCVVLAALFVCSGILRQSYFEVTGRCDNGACIYGVTSDYMVAIYSITMHLLPIIGTRYMIWALSLAVVFMIYASLTFSLRSRRYDGFGLFIVTVYNIILCLSCLVLFVFNKHDFVSTASVLLGTHLVLAYPCYFRFVELNK